MKEVCSRGISDPESPLFSTSLLPFCLSVQRMFGETKGEKEGREGGGRAEGRKEGRQTSFISTAGPN